MLCNYYLISTESLWWAATSVSGVQLSVVPLQLCSFAKPMLKQSKSIDRLVDWSFRLHAHLSLF